MSTETNKFNKELLMKAREKILEHPNHFDMDCWTGKVDYYGNLSEHWRESFSPESPKCGTTACIGGWILALEGKSISSYIYTPGMILGHLIDLLNLTYYEGETLFLLENWEPEFKDRYENSKTGEEKAEVAAGYIEWFIEKIEYKSQEENDYDYVR